MYTVIRSSMWACREVMDLRMRLTPIANGLVAHPKVVHIPD
jgi:hypothetical protein